MKQGEFYLYRVSKKEYSISATAEIGSWERLCAKHVDAITGLNIQLGQEAVVQATFKVVKTQDGREASARRREGDCS